MYAFSSQYQLFDTPVYIRTKVVNTHFS